MLNNCRICLQTETILLKTALPVNNKTYDEELSFCVPEIDWNSSDTPSLICSNCIRNLETAVNFRRLCLESHKTRTLYIEQFSKLSSLENEEEFKLKEELVSHNKPEIAVDELVDGENPYNVSCDNESETEIKEEDALEIETVAQNKNLRKGISRFKNEKLRNASKSEDDVKGNDQVKEECPTENENIDSMKLYVPSRKDRTCIFCNCTFSKYATLANHVRSIHTFEKCFKCDICGEGFTNSEILSRHKNRHTGERKYVCSYCGKKFFTNSDLNHHIQRHQNKRNYKCDICENKSFNTANSLRTHKLVVHTNPNEWKYLCPICGRKCVTQASLTVHVKRHSNEKDFACHLCSKKFCTKSELRKHISSHSNMRLHKCEICNQEYKDKKIMERHLTKKHGIGNAKIVERVKKYFCDVCPKKFVGKRQLEKHLRSHSGERPFKCELCEQAFICSSYIKGHMRSKHLMEVQSD